MTREVAEELGCRGVARIVAYADGATDPIDFPIAPKFALDKLMAQVGAPLHPCTFATVSLHPSTPLPCSLLPGMVKVAPAAGCPSAPLHLHQVGMAPSEVALWEINEAFAVVVLANMQLDGLDHDK